MVGGRGTMTVFEIYIKTTPERLWEAITDGEMRKKYSFGVGHGLRLEAGSEYRSSVPGVIDIASGVNLEVDPPRRLVQSFTALWSEEVEREGESRVTWEIEPVGDSCRLSVTHDQLGEGANSELWGGWPMILSGLKTLLETGELLDTPGSLRYAGAGERAVGALPRSGRGGEVLVDEADDRRALADGGRAALDRAGAHVAGGVDAGDAGLEQALGPRFGAGEDEALLVAGDHVAEPLGAGGGAEEEEEERERQPVAVGERDRLELPVRAVQGADFAAVADRDAVALELLDQVVGHRLARGLRGGAGG